MGSRDAQAYLASPSVVAASAIKGSICGPQHLLTDGPMIADNLSFSMRVADRTSGLQGDEKPMVDILPGFSSSIEGELLFCPADNLNTDAIYPGKYTYKDDLKPKEMAQVVMENYDPQFAKMVKKVRCWRQHYPY